MLLLFLIIFPTWCYSTPKLNVPIVLLPYYSEVPVNFTLDISEGCYAWSSQRPEVATVYPLADENSCSSSAVVTVSSRRPHRLATAVTARRPGTSQMFRCDVIVDKIEEIQIETTTRELFLAHSPEDFVLKAFDSEGNTFSSLLGVPFKWNLVSDAEADHGLNADEVLRIIPYSESEYETPADIAQLENTGKQGYRILVEGTRTGSAYVDVVLDDLKYSSAPHTTVKLIVVANLFLSPPEVYIAPFTHIEFQVLLIKHSKSQKIEMPSSQYALELQDSSICDFHSHNSTAVGLQIGTTRLVLRDKLLKVKKDFIPPSSNIYVVYPALIKIHFSPSRRWGSDQVWILERNMYYEVFLKIYDAHMHQIYCGNEIHVDGTFNLNYFIIHHASDNGTYYIVETLKSGNTDVIGELSSLFNYQGQDLILDPVVRRTDYVDIFDPVEVFPDIVVFPATGSSKFSPEAYGGSGTYSWSSQNSSVVQVATYDGTLTPGYIGETVVIVTDAKNSDLFDTLMVVVCHIVSISHIPSQVEAPLGSQLDLPIAVYGIHPTNGERLPLTDCRYMKMKIRLSDESIFEVASAHNHSIPENEACAYISLIAQEIGSTKVTVSLDDYATVLGASKVVAVYKELTPVDGYEISLLAPGSSRSVMFEGGPSPWVMDPSKFYRRAISSNEELKYLKSYDQKEFHSFVVSCSQANDAIFTATIGNEKSLTNPFPAMSTSEVRITCAFPVRLIMQPLFQPSPNLPPCPLMRKPLSHVIFPVLPRRRLRINVLAYDENGLDYHNSTTLNLHWTSSSNHLSLSKFGERNSYINFNTVSFPNSVHDNIAIECTLEVPNMVGEKVVSAVLHFSVIKQHSLSKSLLTLFNNKATSANVRVLDGSGFFHFTETNNSVISKIVDSKDHRSLIISPKVEGSSRLTVYDICIDNSKPIHTTIHVSGVQFIDVEVANKIQVNNKITLRLSIFDHNHEKLHVKEFEFMNLHCHLSDISKIDLNFFQDVDEFTKLYYVHGKSVGSTNLRFTANYGEHPVSSLSHEIQVYSELVISPKYHRLIPGAVFQFSVTGGPKSSSSISFHLNDSTIGLINQVGVFHAKKLGFVKVTVQSKGSWAGQEITYGEDSATVVVISLAGIRIRSPLSRIAVGNEMPLWISGKSGFEQPFTFPNNIIGLSCNWSTVGGEDVVQLLPTHYKIGVKDFQPGDFAARLVAVGVGHVTIRASITSGESHILPGITHLSDQIRFDVFDSSSLIRPTKCLETLLMAPGSALQLEINPPQHSTTFELISFGNGKNSSTMSVNERGLLTAGEIPEKRFLILKSKTHAGVISERGILVDVQPVAYIMINVHSLLTMKEGSSLSGIPIGMTIEYVVTYHDDIGNVFDATKKQLRHRPSQYDVLDINVGSRNNSFILSVKEMGHKTLKITDSSYSSNLVDYIPVYTSSSAITPSSAQMTVGQYMCFSSPVVTSSFESGFWSSKSTEVLVLPKSGCVLALSSGSVKIRYDVSNLVSYSDIKIHQINQIILDSVENSLNPQKSYKVKVGLFSRNGKVRTTKPSADITSLLMSQSPPFVCDLIMTAGDRSHMSTNDFYTVTSLYDELFHSYVCSLSPVTNVLKLADLSTISASFTLQAALRNSPNYVVSDPLLLKLRPGFFLHNPEVIITSTASLHSQRILVSALPEIQDSIEVKTSDHSILGIQLHEQSDQSLIYKLELKQVPPEVIDLYIYFTSSLLNQKNVTVVKFRLPTTIQQSPEIPSVHHISLAYWLGIFFALIFGGAIIFVCYWCISAPRYVGPPNPYFREHYSQTQPPPYADYPDTFGHSDSSKFLRPSPFSPTKVSPGSKPLWSESYADSSMNIDDNRRRSGNSFDNNQSLRRSPHYNYR